MQLILPLTKTYLSNVDIHVINFHNGYVSWLEGDFCRYIVLITTTNVLLTRILIRWSGTGTCNVSLQVSNSSITNKVYTGERFSKWRVYELPDQVDWLYMYYIYT